MNLLKKLHIALY